MLKLIFYFDIKFKKNTILFSFYIIMLEEYVICNMQTIKILKLELFFDIIGNLECTIMIAYMQCRMREKHAYNKMCTLNY